MFGLAGPAAAAGSYTITFDEVTVQPVNWGVVPDGYMEFDWNFIEFQRNNDYRNTYNNKNITFPSPPYAALNGGESGGNEVVSFASARPFELEGGFFGTWAQNNTFAGFSSRGLTVTGYLGRTEVGSQTFALTPNFAWQEFDFGPVTMVQFTHLEHDNAHWWLMDNLKLSAVPLPTTLGLFCGGLLALAVSGKRRRTG
jgi:hypothetical protein